LPKLKLYSFTNSANITGHRRKLVADGFYDAPLLPPPQAHPAPEPPPEPAKIPRQVKATSNNRTLLIAGAAGVLVMIGLALALSGKSTSRQDDTSPVIAGGEKNSLAANSTPAKPSKTRFDYAVDPARGFVEATQDPDCPVAVRQAIAQELVSKRTQQLDEADIALNDKRLDDATHLANAMLLTDDIAFRDLRIREQDLRARLLKSRTLATVTPTPTAAPTPTVTATPTPTATPVAPIPRDQALPERAAGAVRLVAEAATFPGTYLRIETGGNRRVIAKWNRSSDAAQWKADIPTAGNYRIEAVVASVHNSLLAVEVAGQVVSAATPSTNDWFACQNVLIGVVAVQSPGEQLVRARPLGKDSWRPINLAEIVLTPTTDAVTSAPVVAATPAKPATSVTPAPPDKIVPVVGRFVRVGLPRKEMMSLAEVEVYSDGVNIALKGTASQSSVSYDGEANRAIDGNANGDFIKGSVTHTSGKDQPWWEVDLGGAYLVESVIIRGRTDCCGERLNGYVVEVLDANRRQIARVANAPTPQDIAKINFTEGKVTQGGAQLWNGKFALTGNKNDAVHALPLDGSEHIPPGWPGGTNEFFRSAKGGAKKRQMLALDLSEHNADAGGIVLMLHPMRLDRKQVTATLSDTEGKSVILPPVTFAANDWTVVTYSTKGLDLNAAALQQLTLEDAPSQGFIPEEGGFLLARLATATQREPQDADLRLRTSVLVRDENRMKYLPRLLETIGRQRKRAWKVSTELNRLQVFTTTHFDQGWRNVAQTELNRLTPKPNAPVFGDLTFSEAWLDAYTKGPKPVLDPVQRHIAVLLTGGEELSLAPTAAQALDVFWRKRLEQLIGVGVIPVVVLGPNRQSGERREEAEKLWPLLAAGVGFAAGAILLEHRFA
jgi:hypothetical protein